MKKWGEPANTLMLFFSWNRMPNWPFSFEIEIKRVIIPSEKRSDSS